jgi:hypothetical protein
MQLRCNQQNYSGIALPTAGPLITSVQTATVSPSPTNLDSCIDIHRLECTVCCTTNERSERDWLRLAIWKLQVLRIEAEMGKLSLHKEKEQNVHEPLKCRESQGHRNELYP